MLFFKEKHNKYQRLNSSKAAEVIMLLDTIIAVNKMLSPKIRKEDMIIIDNKLLYKDTGIEQKIIV